MKTYLAGVSDKIKKSFHSVDRLMNQMKNGYEQNYLKILKGNGMVGMFCFNVDH